MSSALEEIAVDFPAAHSMDTTWFAVDADGCVGVFETSEDGALPNAASTGGGCADPSFDTFLFDASRLAMALVGDPDLTDAFPMGPSMSAGARYAGATHAVGAAVEDKALWDPCPHGVEKGRVHEAWLERGSPTVAVFRIYRWEKVYDELMAHDADGGADLVAQAS